MLFVISSLIAFQVDATDGRMGTVSDFLFDDTDWQVRWLVVDTGDWLPGRKVLIHPASIAMKNFRHQIVGLTLTKAQIEASPEIGQDEPLSQQFQLDLHRYYGIDPLLGGAGLSSGEAMVYPSPPPAAGPETIRLIPPAQDPHLQSVDEVTGYHIHAEDGEIGHIQGFEVDEADWRIRYLIADTSNWWPGKHVLIAPEAARGIDCAARIVTVSLSRAQVKASPKWDPLAVIEKDYQQRLHDHYGWPGYGW
jgi:hypothetical protein